VSALDHVQFVRHRVSPIRRHYVDEEDVKVVLSRLPEKLWTRLRKVHFKDDTISCLREALRLDPKHKQAADLLEKLTIGPNARNGPTPASSDA